jgi:hypothetical protein
MTQQIINIGALAEDRTGDGLRVGGDKINANFTELYKGIFTYGSHVLTIGDGGYYETLANALAALNANITTPVDVTGTHNGVLGAAAWGDLYTLSGHTVDFTTIGFNRQTFLEVNSDGILRPLLAVPDGTHLVTVAGRNSGSALVAGTYKFWQFPNYVIQLLPGRHEINSVLQFPDACNITLSGHGPDTTRVVCNQQMFSGRNIRLGKSGMFGFRGLGFERADDATCISGHTTSSASGQGALLSLDDVRFDDLSPTDLIVGGGYCVTGTFAGASLRNVDFGAVGYQMVLNVDSFISQNTKGRYYSGTTTLADHQFDLRHSEYQRTKRWFIQNHVVETFTTGALENQWPIELATSGATVGKTKIVQIDGVSADQGEFLIVGADMRVQLKNVDVNSLNIQSNAVVLGENVRRCDGSNIAPTHSVSGGATYTNVNNGLYTSVAYAATVTPNANRAEIWKIEAMTGALLIAAPTNPQTGQRISFQYLCDATPGRQISYNAIFKTSTVPVSIANGRAKHGFEYDGTNWVQVGGPLIWL